MTHPNTLSTPPAPARRNHGAKNTQLQGFVELELGLLTSASKIRNFSKRIIVPIKISKIVLFLEYAGELHIIALSLKEGQNSRYTTHHTPKDTPKHTQKMLRLHTRPRQSTNDHYLVLQRQSASRARSDQGNEPFCSREHPEVGLSFVYLSRHIAYECTVRIMASVISYTCLTSD